MTLIGQIAFGTGVAFAAIGAAWTAVVLLSPRADREAAPETQDDFTAAMRRWDAMRENVK